MSTESAQLFHQKILSDTELQHQILDSASEAGGMPDWSALGKAAGFDFSNEEAASYLEQFDEDDVELTDFELELVAAGGVSRPDGF